MKKYILPALLLLLGSAGLRAADFWEKKEYKQWKPKDVHKMLTKSPWAQNVSLDPMRMRRGGFENIEGGPTEDPSARRSDPDQSSGRGGGDVGFGSGGAGGGSPPSGSVGSGGGLGPPSGSPLGGGGPGLGGRRPAARRGAASHQCNRALGQRPAGEAGHHSGPLPGGLRGIGTGQAASQHEGRAVRGPVERTAQPDGARPATKHRTHQADVRPA